MREYAARKGGGEGGVMGESKGVVASIYNSEVSLAPRVIYYDNAVWLMPFLNIALV